MQKLKYSAASICALAMISGCKQADTKKDFDRIASIKNLNPEDINTGDLPSGSGPSSFKSSYDVLVFLKFDQDSKLSSSIQYFNSSGRTFASADAEFASLKQGIIDCIKELRADKVKCDRAVATRDLRDLAFRSASNIVFYADTKSLKFKPKFLAFSDTLLELDSQGNPRPAAPNKAFYDERVFENAFDLGSGDMRQLAYVRNHYTKADAAGTGHIPIKPEERIRYAFNFFMTIAQANSVRPIPLIIDPDGGNMGGGGPPP